jgi:hypothetical protein
MLSPSTQQNAVVPDEVAGEPDRVGDAERTALVAIGQVEPEVRAVASSSTTSPTLLPPTMTMTSRIAHRRERLDRVVDHRPVVDRQQVLVRDDRQREQAGRGPAGEDDALHAAERSRADVPTAGPAGHGAARVTVRRATGPRVATNGVGEGVGWNARLLAARDDATWARDRAVDRLVARQRQATLVVEDHEHVLELLEVGRRLQVGGLDDAVRVAPDVDHLAQEEALRVRASGCRRRARSRPS